MNGLLPWHTAQWQTLTRRLRDNILPHALLVNGPPGVGKNHFASLFAHSALCENTPADGLPCGTCRGCLLNQAGTHPDYKRVSPLEEKKIIGVDQVREIGEYFSLKSHYAGYKVVIISPASAMNTQAANSLLKTLEEPPARALLILVTDSAALLPATIRSRCQRIDFTKPPQDLARDWLATRIEPPHDASLLLALADGAPFAALELASGDKIGQRMAMFTDFETLFQGHASPVAIAGTWLKFELKETLYWVRGWITDMIRIKSAVHPPALANQDIQQRLQVMASMLDLRTLHRQLDRISEAARLASGQINGQLLLEDLLIGWKDILSRQARKKDS